MKEKINDLIVVILFLAGLTLLTYPFVSDQWNQYRQNILIASYEEAGEGRDFTEEWELAKAFNETLQKNSVYVDAFGLRDTNLEHTEYWKVLNPAGNGVMGYLYIPRINVELSIYHGTDEQVLEKGIGHLNGTKLPIGGESTHSVLVAHRGLPSARLFTDLDQLEAGDMFYVHVLDETFAYQVDRIQDMVAPDDMETMEAALAIEEGQDYVTLFTCTPYGLNSHRLLVRGSRVPYSVLQEAQEAVPGAMLKAIENYNMVYPLLGISITGLVCWAIRLWHKAKHPKDLEEIIPKESADKKTGNKFSKKVSKKLARIIVKLLKPWKKTRKWIINNFRK